MKITKKIQLFLLTGLVAVFFASCQSEENEIIENPEETLTAAAPLTNLLSRVAMSDATSDNIIDSTDCFKVKLPVQVIVNNQQIQVNSEEDFTTIQAIFDQTTTQYNTVNFVFPITVIYPDYSELTVSDQYQFDILANSCTATGPGPVFDEPISCFSIVYPITISGYTSAVQQAQTYTINSDQELYLFLLNLSSTEYYAVNYPVSVINGEGETITISSNSECEQAILESINFCFQYEEFCQGNDQMFTAIYDSIANYEGVMETTIWSAVTHEYTFSLGTYTGLTLCTIGYESPSIPGNYIFEILKEDGTVIYSGEHHFEADQFTYVSIEPVFIEKYEKYIVRRRNLDESGGGLCKVIKRVEGVEPILPASEYGINIHSSRYYGGGTGSEELDFHHIPKISLGFSYQ